MNDDREARGPTDLPERVSGVVRRLATPQGSDGQERPRSWPFRAFVASHPRLVDASALALILLSISDVHDGHRLLWKLLLDVAFVVPLYWRRRNPLLVLVVVWAVGAVELSAGLSVACDVAIFVALYYVASLDSRRRTVIATVITLVGAFVSAVENERQSLAPAFIAISIFIVAVVLLGLWISNRRSLLLFLEQRAVQLETERDRQARLAAAAERARIAREMHDVVAHNLTVMVALADGARYRVEANPAEAGAAIETVSQTGRRALSEMRRLLGVLGEAGDERAPQPGLADLATLVEEVRGAGLSVAYSVTGTLPILVEGAQLALYRVVQEALTNTLKHAGPAARSRVDIVVGATRLELTVSDTGLGRAAEVKPDGQGLVGMHERISAYGGTVAAGPGERGWRVDVTLPIEETVER